MENTENNQTDATSDLSAWQTIESAPKGRGAILVWRLDRKCTFAATWDDITEEWRHFGGSNYPIGGDVTHWMPLPKPPSQNSKHSHKEERRS